MLEFNNLNVSKGIKRAVAEMGFTAPTPVQELSIPVLLEGRDAVVQAPTGTGKTCGFGIPIINGIDRSIKATQALVVCPTRELAMQISDVLKQLAKYSEGVRVLPMYGGSSMKVQMDELKKHPQIIVATPGRLLDHMNRRTVDLKEVKFAVLDEADRMLDMGFRQDISRILRATPKDKQTVMFSATMPHEIMHLADQYLRNPASIRVGEDRPIDTIKQYYYEVDDKMPLLRKLLDEKDFDLALIFVATKHRADRIAKQLAKNGYSAAAIHGDMSQSQRERVMRNYRGGKLKYLVATDVAARGIDVQNIDAVINLDIPNDPDSYTHRIGRTGRASKYGEAYTFVRAEDRELLNQIVKNTNATIEKLENSLQPVIHEAYMKIEFDDSGKMQEKKLFTVPSTEVPAGGAKSFNSRRRGGRRSRAK